MNPVLIAAVVLVAFVIVVALNIRSKSNGKDEDFSYLAKQNYSEDSINYTPSKAREWKK